MEIALCAHTFAPQIKIVKEHVLGPRLKTNGRASEER